MYIPQGYAFLYGSVFSVMKKNEIQKARTKASEVRSQKEQMEDRAFNRMLLWLAGTVLTEVVLLLVNRYYIHARVEELDNLATLHTILGIAPIAGVVLFAGFLYWGLQQRKKGDEHRDGIIQIILASAFLVMGLGAFGMRMYGAAIAPMILGIVPGLGVLMLVFYLYQKEFFVSAFAGGLGILGLWVFRSTGGGTHYLLYLVLALVIIAAVLALVLKLKKADGVMEIRGKKVALFQPGAVYLTYYITAAITAVLLIAPLALGAAVAYYAIWVMAAWLFILAVYFTSKLM